jgi:hypothetical protein
VREAHDLCFFFVVNPFAQKLTAVFQNGRLKLTQLHVAFLLVA